MRGNQKICWEITCEMAADLEPCVGERSLLCWQGGGSMLPWREQVTARTRCAVPCRSALVCLSLVPAAPPWPGQLPVLSRSMRRCVLWLARPSEVRQGCGNTPDNSACPTKWPHFHTFPPISILSHVFQNCPRPCMPWRKINFQCNTHREIHVQNMFFLCQKKNNK